MIKKRIFKETGKVKFYGRKRISFPKPPKPQRKKSYWKRKADTLMSKFIRNLDHCERDGEIKNLQAAHIYSRSNLRLRYEIANILCLCSRCHFWAHKNPVLFTEWLQIDYPERLEYLRQHKDEIKKMTIDDYKEVIRKLNN